MKLTPVEGSSNIAAIGYDPEGGKLHVKFHNGATYSASEVPPEDHEKFMAADSKGKYFGKLRTIHVFSRVMEKQKDD